MRYSEGKTGRVFVLRLDEGDVLNETVEAFAREHAIEAALAFYLGGGTDGSRLVVGPDAAHPERISPLIHTLTGSHEVLAIGTIFRSDEGRPVAHIHAAAGREGGASVGCTRAGLTTWLIGEVVLLEILGSEARRAKDPVTGFELLEAAPAPANAAEARPATADGATTAQDRTGTTSPANAAGGEPGTTEAGAKREPANEAGT